MHWLRIKLLAFVHMAATSWLKSWWINLRWEWNSYNLMLDLVEKCHIMKQASGTKWVPSKIWYHTTNTWRTSIVPGTEPGCSVLNNLNAFGVLVGMRWPCTRGILQFRPYQSLTSLGFNTSWTGWKCYDATYQVSTNIQTDCKLKDRWLSHG